MRAVPVLLLLCLASPAEESIRPRHNDSFVPADDASLLDLMQSARAAAEAGAPERAAERLQAILLETERGLLPIHERLLFVDARRWAQIQLLAEDPPFRAPVLAAWRRIYDGEASGSLRAAIAAGDEDELLRLLDRYPAATAAPAALLALADRALQRGDPDGARGHLLRVPEHVARSEEEALLASPAYRARRDHLWSLPARRTGGWPTHGGDMTRARAGDPLAEPGALRLAWESFFLEQVPPLLAHDEASETRDYSPRLPFLPVCDEERLYVHLGPAVAALDRATGKLLFYAPEGGHRGLEAQVDELVARNPGLRAATVEDGTLYFARALFDTDFDDRPRPRLSNALVAFDVARRRTLWEVRPGPDHEGAKILQAKVYFRGAPALDRERLYVYGAIRDEGDDGATRREAGHLFCFRRATGELLWHRFLGYGTTEASPEFPPLSGLAPALSAGVVVAVTGMGVAAALDARSGEVLWLFRYDRRPARERERLAEEGEERKVHLRGGWKREPPRIAGDTVYFAPFDAEELFACWLRGARPPTRTFEIELYAKHRARGHRHSLLEYVAGPAAGRMVYVGRRDPRRSVAVAYQTVVSHPLDRAVDLAYGLLPSTERDDGVPVPPELYGRPAIAGGALLVPTRWTLFRFDVGTPPAATLAEGERRVMIALLAPFAGPERDTPGGPPSFGNLVAIDGFLYAATADRIYCYGPE